MSPDTLKTITDTIHNPSDTVYTQISETHTVVTIIDTITVQTKFFINDTIQPDLLQVYKELITAQDDKFDYLLATITVIVTVLIILITFFNFSVAQKLFKRQAIKIFNDQKKEFKEEIIKSINPDIAKVKAESARSFALINVAQDKKINVLNWFIHSVYHYNTANEDKKTRIILIDVKNAIQQLKNDINSSVGKHDGTIVNFTEMKNKIDSLPDILSIEKQEILKDIGYLEDKLKSKLKVYYGPDSVI